jgi:hypothetical protein
MTQSSFVLLGIYSLHLEVVRDSFSLQKWSQDGKGLERLK